MRNVFYRGWTNWLRGGLGAAFDASASPYLTAYPGQAWPVDSTVAMASLRLHDTLLPARFGGTVERWLREVRERLDPRTGLLPHRVDPNTGEPVEGARGSSQSVIHRFLIDVDPSFARDQYLRFRDGDRLTPSGSGPESTSAEPSMPSGYSRTAGPSPSGETT